MADITLVRFNIFYDLFFFLLLLSQRITTMSRTYACTDGGRF